ncbi:hypothetical protein K6W36_15280 [Acetobacter senegalensis]|uniref:hypothetical protein n=1 Tax=Acetobacter senegalensis TaxID=446692 RepID=UPI001ED9D517|nr:hypothetical protein [Acetobacter senegalensis]MCG4261920.1 hypothetical protein [Acetobacter senegalensis]
MISRLARSAIPQRVIVLSTEPATAAAGLRPARSCFRVTILRDTKILENRLVKEQVPGGGIEEPLIGARGS